MIQETKSNVLKELSNKLKNSKSYMVCASVLNEDGKLEHILLTEAFPTVDMLASHKQVENLIIKQLKENENIF